MQINLLKISKTNLFLKISNAFPELYDRADAFDVKIVSSTVYFFMYGFLRFMLRLLLGLV